jgi:hypothetical protein
MSQVLYKGRKRKIHIGKRGGKYVIVKGEKRYLKPKSSASKKKTKTSKRIKGGGKEYDLNDEYSIESRISGYYVKHKPSKTYSKKVTNNRLKSDIKSIIGAIEKFEKGANVSDFVDRFKEFYLSEPYSSSNKKKREEYNNKIRKITRRRNNFLNNSARYNSQRYMELLEKLNNHHQRKYINKEGYQYIKSELKYKLAAGISLPTNTEFNEMIRKKAKQGFFDILAKLEIPYDEREQLIHDLYQRYPLPTFTQFLTILKEFYISMLKSFAYNIQKKNLLTNNEMESMSNKFNKLVLTPFNTVYSENLNKATNIIPNYHEVKHLQQEIIELAKKKAASKKKTASLKKKLIENYP